MTRGNDSLHFYYGADGHPTVVEYNGVSYSYAYNLQGDVISLQDADGWTQVQYAYDAWGHPIGKTGAMANTLGTLNPFRYRGYIYDEETGLYYLRSRYYNPAWGRFIQTDSALIVKNLADNLFTYCANDPVALRDVNGHSWFDDICKAANNIVDFIFPGSTARTAKILSGRASFGDVLDWITLGYSGTAYRATHPQKPLSLQHWLDSASTVATPFCFYKSIMPKTRQPITWPAEAFNPLANTTYSSKVIGQMKVDKVHGFPTIIDTLATFADASTFVGGDHKIYTRVKIPGTMIINNKCVKGVFEYIIDPNGLINHRFFNFK